MEFICLIIAVPCMIHVWKSMLPSRPHRLHTLKSTSGNFKDLKFYKNFSRSMFRDSQYQKVWWYCLSRDWAGSWWYPIHNMFEHLWNYDYIYIHIYGCMSSSFDSCSWASELTLVYYSYFTSHWWLSRFIHHAHSIQMFHPFICSTAIKPSLTHSLKAHLVG